MSPPTATKRSRRPAAADAPTMPDPVAIVRFYIDPSPIVREYVESDFAQQLAIEHERKVKLLVEEGAAVTDAISYQRVGERLKDVAAHRKEVEAWFDPIVSFAYRLHAMICARKNEVLDPLLAYERAAKANRLALERADAQRRREEEQRLAEIAQAEERERLAREAQHLEARGEPELAAQVLEQAVYAPPPVITIASSLPQTKGVGSRENWQWRPIGGDTRQARARAVALIPREFLDLNDRALTAFAKAHGNTKRIPGIEFYDAGSVVVR
jgi:hypothetical protein